MKLSVFCGVSVDGFLARLDNSLDFLENGEQEPHGFEEFFNSVDVVVIGRKTFEVVLTIGKWLHGEKQVVVLSSRPLDLSVVKGKAVEQMSGEPSQIDRLVITRVPVLIGSGVPLFGPVPSDIHLRHLATRSYKGGLVQSEYELGLEQRSRV
jgi:dihydrofolate reductase